MILARNATIRRIILDMLVWVFLLSQKFVDPRSPARLSMEQLMEAGGSAKVQLQFDQGPGVQKGVKV